MRHLVIATVLGILTASPLHAENKSTGIRWESWSDDLFDKAAREKKFVLLDLEAVWCHWCHVMDEKTYADPRVIRLIESRFIPVRVDQDSRPDLANRYEDYGWPATVVFDSSGSEIVKRQGFIEPDEMASMLEAIIKDPTPGPSVRPPRKIKYSEDASLSKPLRESLERRLFASYDSSEEGWGTRHKFLPWDNVEYCLLRSREGDDQARRMAKGTLAAQLRLMDPVWGGVYQYSTGGKWNQPHFEKIMQFQAENIRIYSMAYRQWPDHDYLMAAGNISRYLKRFLTSPEGAFYTSQDADVVPGKHSERYFDLGDEQRQSQGIPRIDKNIYSRENGWAIRALAEQSMATASAGALADATRAADWVLKHRSIPGGGFRHGESDGGGPYLGDTLAMGRAFLALHTASGDRKWLGHATRAAEFMDARFRNPDGPGYVTSDPKKAGLHAPAPQREENIELARFTNLLHHYTGKAEFRKMAERAMTYLSTPEVAEGSGWAVGGILLAERELGTAPLHLTIVGRKDDPRALLLFQEALRTPAGYKQVEWLDPAEGPLPNPKVEFPHLKVAAAFICTDTSCSAPIYRREDLPDAVEKHSR